MGENVFLHLGQAGCQMGLDMWELFCMEHGIFPDGTLATVFGHTRKEGETLPFFYEARRCKYVPRALFFDFDPDLVKEIRTGTYRELFNKDLLISGKEDAANNFARGYITLGSEFIECFMDRLRHVVESMDYVKGIVITRGVGAGTGAGFGSLIIEKCADLYPKGSRVSFEVHPSPRLSSAAVEPYNCVLAGHHSMDMVNLNFIFENESVYSIFRRHLCVQWPTYKNVNQLIAQIVSALTASFRFEGSINSDWTQIQTNVTPFPRLHFPLLSYSPVIPYERVYHDLYSVRSLTNDILDPKNQLLKCNPRKGKYIAASILYRGDVTPNDVNDVVQQFKRSTSQKNRMQFVDWSPGGFKVGLCYQPPIAVPGSHIACCCRAAVGILNTTAVAVAWQRILKKFDMMFRRKAFVHWYKAEGMEDEEFTEARQNVESLMVDFHEASYSSAEGAPPYKGYETVDIFGDAFTL